MMEWDAVSLMNRLDGAYEGIDEVIENIRAMGFDSKADEIARYAARAYEVAMDTLEDYERE